jgi:CheY-like chemotaxis protein
VSLPCKLFQNGTEIGDGEVVDVSIGGCGILTSVDLHFDSQVAVTFFLPNGVQIQNAELSVRSVRKRSDVQRFLGCEFRGGQDQAQNEIAAFVMAELRPGNGGRGKAACAILLIEDNPETRDALSARLKQSGYEATGVSTAIEGFCRLFTSRPSLLIVSQEQKDLPGLDIVRAAKANPAFATLPIFLYGGRDKTLKERALKAGAARYFPATDAVVNVCNAVAAWAAHGDTHESQAASARQRDAQ